jgi:general transcriptional corepressor CYC8
MATHHPSPTGMQLHHGPPAPPPGMGPTQQAPWPQGPPSQQIAAMNEAVWLQIGKLNIMPTEEEFLCLTLP